MGALLPGFREEETEAEKVENLPEVPWLVNSHY